MRERQPGKSYEASAAHDTKEGVTLLLFLSSPLLQLPNYTSCNECYLPHSLRPPLMGSPVGLGESEGTREEGARGERPTELLVVVRNDLSSSLGRRRRRRQHRSVAVAPRPAPPATPSSSSSIQLVAGGAPPGMAIARLKRKRD